MDINDVLAFLGYLGGGWGLGWIAGYFQLTLRRMFDQV